MPAQEPLPHGVLARVGSLQSQHGETVSAVVFSPDQQTIFAAGSDGKIHLWPLGKDKRNRTLDAHKEEIRGLAVSPDGKTLYTASVDRSLRFWNVEDLKELKVLENTDDGFESLALSTDGKRLAVGGRDGSIWLLDANNRQKKDTLVGHKSGVVSLAFSPDGKKLASGSWDNRIILWDVEKSRELKKLDKHEDYVESLIWTSDGKTLISGSKDGTIRVWEFESGKELRSIQAEQGCVWALAFSQDEKILFAGGDGSGKGYLRSNTLVGWDWKAGKVTRSLPGHGLIPREGQSDFRSPFKGTACLALSADGKLLASGGADRRLRVWDLATGKDTRSQGNGHQDWVTDLAFSDDGKKLVTASRDQTARVWDGGTGKEVHALPAQERGYTIIRFLTGSTQVIAGCADGGLLLWDTATGKEVRRWKSGLKTVSHIGLSDDGKLLACASTHEEDRLVMLFDPAMGKEVKSFKYNEGMIRSLALSPDGKRLAFVHSEDELTCWNLDTGKALPKIACRDDVTWLRYSPDNRQLLGVSLLNAEAIWWDADTGKKLREGDPAAQNNAVFAVTRDGRTLAVGGVNPDVRLFESGTALARRALSGHRGPITALTFSRDGHYLASAGMDQTVLIWDRRMPRADAPKQLDAGSLGRAWNELSGEDESAAYDALCLLAAHPQTTMPFLNENVRAIGSNSTDRIDQLIKDLDADSFKVREKASRELAQLGRTAEKALKATLAKTSSAEVKKRIEDLLSKLVGDAPLEDWVRLSRSVELLEMLGTREAKALLEKLASGGAAPPTEEAKAALKRWPKE